MIKKKLKKNKFQRTKYRSYVRLGSGQKSKLRYQRAKGRHNKTRQKWRSRPPMVEIGYKNKCSERHIIDGRIPVRVFNLRDLMQVAKDSLVIIAKVGEKNKVEIAKEAQKRKIDVLNLNLNKFLKEIERKSKLKNKDKKESKETESKKEVKAETESKTTEVKK